MIKRSHLATAFLLLAATVAPCNAQTATESKIYSEYPGDYRTGDNHIVGIDHYITEDRHENRLIYSDYTTGIVRLLTNSADGEFSMGPEFDVSSPVELNIRFTLSDEGKVTGLKLERPGQPETFAERIPLKQTEVSFQNGNVTLAGTLLMPETSGPHPGMILLHGSAPLTRYSFGPYPHFFTSLGFAVLIYDKRGSGASTGTYLDEATYYPDGFTSDALAAFQLLQSNKDINPNRIGFWGSSEGGMLATQVAARSQQVAFIINSSGFMMPLWQQSLYHTEAAMRDEGYPEHDIEEAVAYNKLIIRVGRTGRGWDQFKKRQQEVRNKNWFSSYSTYISSREAIRQRWTHILSFSPLPALKKVRCPVLGLFGQIDNETPASIAVSNMRHGLTEGGNKGYSLKIFPNANHALMLGTKTMAPGVFQTISSWLSQTIRVTPVNVAKSADAFGAR